MAAQRDYYTKRGAEELAERIRIYWRGRGKFPRVWTEPLTFTQEAKLKENGTPHTVTLYMVRSNMVGGLPV